MSTEFLFHGIPLFKILYVLAGFLGGFLPFFYDLISRQKMPAQQKIELNLEFFCIKCLLMPFLALIFTGFAVIFNSINDWLAALYLGASLPVLIEKAIGSSAKTIESLGREQ
ncbi:hypothetical protein [Ectopseudomonas hydrolytica]|uniref:hypothetical protein n=1 Tax=Ectopseudomonas hydrolytica TaxID=2493633 RepID=UPI0020B8EA07|nr:hypothetical protein [Pseudomonas hydrolytica]UTH30091.1 hypothetical protein NLY38_16800 [Pseudomonas hydrolytica]UZZ09102.1 hypothetical protein NDO41_17055 [Pseudomonas mendocina]